MIETNFMSVRDLKNLKMLHGHFANKIFKIQSNITFKPFELHHEGRLFNKRKTKIMSGFSPFKRDEK